MDTLQLLNRNEMKEIKAGSMSACGIYVSGEWSCGYSYSAALGAYEAFDNVTGYCCTSCGEEGFLGSPC